MKLDETVPLETFLDSVLIEEIPFDQNAQGSGLVGANGEQIIARTERALKFPPTGIVLSCGERFPMSGIWIDNPYRPGDVVRVNETGRDPIVLYPEEEFKPDAKKHYIVRYDDIYGRVKTNA